MTSQTPGNLEELLQRLEASAAQRNEEAASIPEILANVESRMQALGVKSGIWLEDAPLSRQELSVSASTVAPRVDVQLGFGEVRAGTFGLLIREAEYVPEPTVGSGEDYVFSRTISSTPLARTPHETQIEALDLLPALLESLVQRLESQTESIRRARKLSP